MELIYDRRLVHYLGSDKLKADGKHLLDFSFRDGSGEKFNIQVEQEKIPPTFFGNNISALERTLQSILDQHARHSNRA